MKMLSVRKSYEGKHVLLTGASGFVGKVWLSMMLSKVPEIGRIYVLIRRGKSQSAFERFEEILGGSPAFLPLHEKYGDRLPSFLNEKLEVLEGDVSLPRLGLGPEQEKRLRGRIDLIVHCAGLVDFEPELQDALSANVTGVLHVVDFAKSCSRARLVHISTCFVCGKTGGGHANETLQPDYNPKGETFSAEREYEEALEAAGREAPPGQDRFQVCRDRALRWGWPNGYTYTKSLAESLLQNRAENLSYTVVRPAIVESAMKFPFPGWNEGAETCTPISYLAGNGIKHFTARKHYTLDIVPVDAVCESIAIAGAALLNGVAFSVYQCGSSFRNPLKIGRMLELIALAHRAHYRRHGGTTTERLLLSRWDAVTVSEESFFSVGSLREAAVRLNQFAKQWEAKTSGFLKEWIHSATVLTHRAKWALIKAEKIIRIFLPFIYENHFRFVCENLEKHEVREEEFRFEPGKIDWRHYILDIHEPGIRKWCYPLIENKPVEKLNLSYPFRLSEEGGEREFPRRVSRG